ncbi:MAG TPA: efflux RND transporter periplasmic adaptor subunit [Gemmatimonadales bacterium]|nr:efflux RND transporter periplasmic adaptor subunit [Gemmatimonadales bacterium]
MNPRISLPLLALLGVVATLGVAVTVTHARRAAVAPAAPGAGAPSDVSSADGDLRLPPGARGVATEAVHAERLADRLEVPGTIEADPTRVVRVFAPVSGRLVAVRVRPADRVEQGRVVAIVASSDVAAARSAFRQAQADAQVKTQALERSRLLYDNKVVALRDYQQAQADAAMAAAALASAVERLELLGADTAGASDQVAVTAPRAGVVTDVGAAPGEYAKSLDNANPLCTIADLSVVWAVGNVYEKDLASVHAGDSADVTLAAYPGMRWRGRIAAVGSVVDTTTRTLQVRVELANAALRLKPAMFASIGVVRATRSALVVPATAVVHEDGTAWVLVQTTPGRFAHRTVTLGPWADRGRVEVTSGLVPGDTVVVEGAELLSAAGAAS